MGERALGPTDLGGGVGAGFLESGDHTRYLLRLRRALLPHTLHLALVPFCVRSHVHFVALLAGCQRLPACFLGSHFYLFGLSVVPRRRALPRLNLQCVPVLGLGQGFLNLWLYVGPAQRGGTLLQLCLL